MSVVTLWYYILCGLITALVVWNTLREQDLKNFILYLLILTPLILRLCRVN